MRLARLHPYELKAHTDAHHTRQLSRRPSRVAALCSTTVPVRRLSSLLPCRALFPLTQWTLQRTGERASRCRLFLSLFRPSLFCPVPSTHLDTILFVVPPSCCTLSASSRPSLAPPRGSDDAVLSPSAPARQHPLRAARPSPRLLPLPRPPCAARHLFRWCPAPPSLGRRHRSPSRRRCHQPRLGRRRRHRRVGTPQRAAATVGVAAAVRAHPRTRASGLHRGARRGASGEMAACAWGWMFGS